MITGAYFLPFQTSMMELFRKRRKVSLKIFEGVLNTPPYYVDILVKQKPIHFQWGILSFFVMTLSKRKRENFISIANIFRSMRD